MRPRGRAAMSSGATIGVAVVVIIALAAVGYFSVLPGGQISDLQSQASSVQSQNSQLKQSLSSVESSQSAQFASILERLNSSQQATSSLPVMNQTPTVRTIRETWYLSPEAHQDRFDPAFIVVNQGDTVHLTLIDNDTVAHDFVVGPPYDIVVNATVPGLVNDLTGQKFTTPAKNNSPGVIVTGTPGNVSVAYSFVANNTGIFEFVCTYHAQVGMIGYLVVLPNLSYQTPTAAGHPGTGTSGAKVVIVPGAGSNTSLGPRAFSPDPATVIIGENATVTWVNNDTAPHTVTANDGSFGSGNIAPGSSFTFTFTKAGVYKYHCVYHPWMVGTVVVKGG